MSHHSDGILLLSAQDVMRCLSLDECFAATREALIAVARGDVFQPLRSIYKLPHSENGYFGFMPGARAADGLFGAKVVSVFPDNFNAGVGSHLGVILLHEARRGRLLAILDAGHITALRTAAASAVATHYLAKKNATTLALLGYGEQAMAHLRAIAGVRSLDDVRVWGRSSERAARFVENARAETGLSVRAVDTPANAVDACNIVCTVTSSRTPILNGEWISSGTHLNIIGASTADAREVDGEMMARSTIFADCRNSLIAQGGDFVMARDEGFVSDTNIIAEIGKVADGSHPGRTADDEITLFKSLGVIAEDLFVAHAVYEAARQRSLGQRVAL